MFLVAPVGTRRNNNVIITSRRRFDVTVTLLLRRVPAGLLASARYWHRSGPVIFAPRKLHWPIIESNPVFLVLMCIIIRILNGNTRRCVNNTRSHLNLWLTFACPHLWVSIWQLDLSTAQNDSPKFRRSSWQFCWLLTPDLTWFNHSMITGYDSVYYLRNG